MSAGFWFLVIFAFFFGVLTGWLLQRRMTVRDRPAETGTAPPAKIGALEAELKAARTLLEAKDADATLAAETLALLDETIKRANDRLKLIVKAVKNSKFGG